MSKPIRNDSRKYRTRAKIGAAETKNSPAIGTKKSSRSDFKVNKQGYFIWKDSKPVQ